MPNDTERPEADDRQDAADVEWEELGGSAPEAPPAQADAPDPSPPETSPATSPEPAEDPIYALDTNGVETPGADESGPPPRSPYAYGAPPRADDAERRADDAFEAILAASKPRRRPLPYRAIALVALLLGLAALAWWQLGDGTFGEGCGGNSSDSVLSSAPSGAAESSAAVAEKGEAADGEPRVAIDWIPVGGGSYGMGSREGEENARPVHDVTVATLLVARSETTVDQYAACVAAEACTQPDAGGGCNWNQDERLEHPVNCVDWNQATAFCEWAGGRLLSEAEWEYLARSSGAEIPYPWGEAAPTCDRATMRKCKPAGTTPVCAHPDGKTKNGLCDMAGNVREWTADIYHPTYRGAPKNGSARKRPEGVERVLRGGSYETGPSSLETTHRDHHMYGHRGPDMGFRCARNPADLLKTD